MKRLLTLIFSICFFAQHGLAAVSAGGASGPPGATQPPETPNIILIIADDIGWNDIGCYGNEAVHTPNIDRIAGEGIRFTGAYVTTSSCSPSRVSILSGRYPHNTGAAELHTPLPAHVPIFAELLRDAGYYTAQAGKWHMGEAAKRGFDLIQEKREENGPGGEDLWVKTLRDRPEGKPFFMWFAAFDAHRPWENNEFKGKNLAAEVVPPPFLADMPGTRDDLLSYYDEITRFDHYIGLVTQELRRQEVEDNTLIIILSDNGRPFPRSKTRLYDSGVKTPFIVKWPRGIGQAGAVSHSLLSSIDIAPTLLELAGISAGPSFQGKSFSALFKDPSKEFRQYVFTEHNWHDHQALERMVRSKHFLYILNLRPGLSNNGPADSNKSPSFQDLKELRDEGLLTAAQADAFVTPRPREELFDYRTDPMQLLNIASVPGYEKELKALRQKMEQWRRETADTSPRQLTGDWYDRETGEALGTEQIRGEMPGAAKGADTVNNKGPF